MQPSPLFYTSIQIQNNKFNIYTLYLVTFLNNTMLTAENVCIYTA